jgi:K+-transporting ATPase c subunit
VITVVVTSGTVTIAVAPAGLAVVAIVVTALAFGFIGMMMIPATALLEAVGTGALGMTTEGRSVGSSVVGRGYEGAALLADGVLAEDVSGEYEKATVGGEGASVGYVGGASLGAGEVDRGA